MVTRVDVRDRIWHRDPTHPLADRHGEVPEHRRVAYDHCHGRPQPCHWCGAELRWGGEQLVDRLVIDHLNGDRRDNRPENLVPACQQCNLWRATTAWVCVDRAVDNLAAADPNGTRRIAVIRAALSRSQAVAATQPLPKESSASRRRRS